jgi:hypothetical protein
MPQKKTAAVKAVGATMTGKDVSLDVCLEIIEEGRRVVQDAMGEDGWAQEGIRRVILDAHEWLTLNCYRFLEPEHHVPTVPDM